MAVPPALVVVVEFDPPKFHFVGPVREATVQKLNVILPLLTRNIGSARRDPPVFKQDPNLPVNNWSLEMKGMLTDLPSRMSILYALLRCLEEEGGWKLHDTLANTEDYREVNTFFFTNNTMK